MEKYTKLHKIGEGSFGNAYLVKANGSDKKLVMKEVDMTKVSFSSSLHVCILHGLIVFTQIT